MKLILQKKQHLQCWLLVGRDPLHIAAMKHIAAGILVSALQGSKEEIELLAKAHGWEIEFKNE